MCRYINTDNDDEKSIEKLIKLYNGAKWKGKILKVEKAKPSYLDRLKEKDVPKEESIVKEEEAPQPPSSDSLMIRKTKRKYLVVSLHTICRNEYGDVISSAPEGKSVPEPNSLIQVQKDGEEGIHVSTRKHRFIQPQITVFEHEDVIDTDRNLWDPLKTPERRLPTLPQITPSFTTSSIQIVGEPQPAPTPSPSFAKSTIQIDGDAPASPKQERFVDLSGSDGEGEEAPIPAEAPLPSWLEESEESEEAKAAGVVKSVDCCVVEDAATSAKREWSEKHKEIEEKRRRMEAEQPEEEEEMAGDVDIATENEKSVAILHSMLGNPPVSTSASNPPVSLSDDDSASNPPMTTPVNNPPVSTPVNSVQVSTSSQPISSLFEDSNVASFSLFNFMPETAAPTTDSVVDLEAESAKGGNEDKKNVLDMLAPTAWYNEKKTSQKAKMLQVPILAGKEKKKVPRVFDHYFFRTVGVRGGREA
ncbi:hypothetical protein BLSTO_04318 [Blastocystis sp. subtype 1]